MKRLFTLSVLLTLVLGVSAQTYRKSWDFTKWSATTVANLKAESAKGPSTGAWSDVEKKDATAPTDISKDNCFWEVTHQGTSEGVTIMANDEPIAELEGLLYTNTTDRSLAIAVNYGDCTPTNGSGFGPYHGPSYLWFGGSKKNYFVIPHVEPGTTIKMGVESHKLTDARGVELYIGYGTSGTKLLGEDGNAVAAPTDYTDQTWVVPTDATDTPNDDGTYDIQIYNTNGCHIYYITVGDGDEPPVEDAKKVAYLYEGDIDMDYAYIFLDADSRFDVTPFNSSALFGTNLSANFDAIVVSPTVTSASLASSLKQQIAFIPIVNLSAGLYDTWGLGNAIEVTTSSMTTTSNDIFEGLDEVIDYEGNIAAVQLGTYFANDDVLATAGNAVAIHVHNPGRNAYYYLPATNMSEPVYTTLIPQTVLAAAKTKRDVVPVGTPLITFTQEDGLSTVTISAANAKNIYYTTDGSEPTTASTIYTEPFALTSSATVKAFATGDGYTDSQVGEKDVTIAYKAAAPAFTLTREDGKTIVELSTSTGGADIYYNFAGQSAITASVKYSEPFEVTLPTTVTAFAAGEDMLTSETTQQFIDIKGMDDSNLRWNVLAHFNANAESWQGKGQQTNDAGEIINANYFFTWGKNAGQYWDETSEQVQKVDGEGNPVFDDNEEPVMTYTKTLDGESYESDGWIIKSIGQVMVWEKLNIGWNIGDTSMRNPDTAEDAIGVNATEGITENCITFGKQPSDGPFNASLETKEKYVGPFDVIVYAGNGNDGEIPTMQIETSTDGQTWTKLGDVAFSLIKRNWKRTQLSFENGSSVYVRLLHTAAKSSGQIYDIYIMNSGGQGSATGINDVQSTVRANGSVYSLSGIRSQQLRRGVNIVVGNDGNVRKVMVK